MGSDRLLSIKNLMFNAVGKVNECLSQARWWWGRCFWLHLSARIPHPAGVFETPLVVLWAGCFKEMPISLNGARREICAMCGFSKLSVTNAATAPSPLTYVATFPSIKNQIVCKANLSWISLPRLPLYKQREILCVIYTNCILPDLAVPNRTIIKRLRMPVPSPC